MKQAREELARREKELELREQALQKDADALQQWKDLYRGLGSEKISQRNRDAFLQLANIAWTEGRLAREAEEQSRDEKGAKQSGMRSETK